MARQKEKDASTATPLVGTIKHKPKGKETMSTKQELKLRKKGVNPKDKPATKNPPRVGGTGDKVGRKSPAFQAQKKGELLARATSKSKAQLDYKGTMRPLPTKNHSSGHVATFKTQKTRSTSQVEDDDEESLVDDGSDRGEYSDESEDMEAGMTDVEEEERNAELAAKREDAAELRLEKELKRQKEARKKREEEMEKKSREWME